MCVEGRGGEGGGGIYVKLAANCVSRRVLPISAFYRRRLAIAHNIFRIGYHLRQTDFR